MEMEPFENPWIKKIRGLTHLLIVSIAANIAFATAYLYRHFAKEGAVKENFSKQASEVILKDSSGAVLKRYFDCTQEMLIGELRNSELLQDGLKRRDLALACLVNFHYFDIERALSGTKLQRRELSFVHHGGGEKFDLEVFSGLDDTHYQMILSFAKREEWPLTPKGLFTELLHGEKKESATLKGAFMASGEYLAVFTAFKRFGEEIGREKLLQCILEGSWGGLEAFRKKQLREGISMESIREFLRERLLLGSKEAASLWIKMEPEYILRNLSDEELSKIIVGLRENTLATTLFLKKSLNSVRSDTIRELAGKKLYEFKEGKAPENYNHEEALHLFLPSLFVEKEVKVEKKEAPVEKIHQVQDGDSLWKISKRYHVSIEELRAKNHLKSDRLRPGQEIVIP